MKTCIQNVFEKTGEIEADDMVSNLGKNLEESINKKVNSAKKEIVIEIAKKMLQRGTSVDIVAEDTELSIEEVESIKKTLVN